MTKEEVWDFCLRAVWEQQLLNRSKWLLILVVVALECIIVPWEVPLVMVLLLLGILVALIAKNYFAMKEQLCGKTRTLWVEDGMLKSLHKLRRFIRSEENLFFRRGKSPPADEGFTKAAEQKFPIKPGINGLIFER